ncbi:MAG: hypothetical protein CM15mV124_020 [uncultured marine virus]|nr:MAG: hypothetical protein CM15mV124_020 [uncultured marine virus]
MGLDQYAGFLFKRRSPQTFFWRKHSRFRGFFQGVLNKTKGRRKARKKTIETQHLWVLMVARWCKITEELVNRWEKNAKRGIPKFRG